MFKKLLSGLKKKREPQLPVIGEFYHHKDKDPYDMVDYVIVQWISPKHGHVGYKKFYKDPSMDMADDQTTVYEFNKWYRRGR